MSAGWQVGIGKDRNQTPLVQTLVCHFSGCSVAKPGLAQL